MLPRPYFRTMKAFFSPILLACILTSFSANAQGLLRAGPMNGRTEMREVAIWVQTIQSCEVGIEYWPIDQPSKVNQSSLVTTNPETANTAILIAGEVSPGKEYAYKILLDSAPTGRIYHFKTQPNWVTAFERPTVKFATGSCTFINDSLYDYPGKSYGNNYQIFDNILSQKPDFMLWLGDNLYLRNADWTSKSGILKRYEHFRSTAELQNLWSGTHHYAIWDDHDYGPNDANGSFGLKHASLEAFKAFWANPYYGIQEGASGITSSFSYADLDFFLLDNRWYRTDPNLNATDEQVFGKEQIEWLIQNLKFSKAPFKFVATGGQILNDEKVYETYANYEAERAYLLSRIVEEGIKGVVFLTGDRHHTELSRLERNGIVLYDLTVSPLTSGAHANVKENNTLRVEGTLIETQNFAVVTVSGKAKERILEMAVLDSDGKLLWKREIAEGK